MGLLDYIFPKYCVNCRKIGSYLCSDCFSYLSFDVSDLCLICQKPSINGFTHPTCQGKYSIDGVFSAINYKGVAKKLVYGFKYKPHLTDLKTVLVDLFYEALIQKEGFSFVLKSVKELILVSIPLYRSRVKSRGYNQAGILASELASKLGLRAQDLLERIKDTRSQVGLKQKERQENISGAFKIKSDQLLAIRHKQFILVDDVLTTGSTFLEAANVLKRNGVKKVWGVTLARD